MGEAGVPQLAGSQSAWWVSRACPLGPAAWVGSRPHWAHARHPELPLLHRPGLQALGCQGGRRIRSAEEMGPSEALSNRIAPCGAGNHECAERWTQDRATRGSETQPGALGFLSVPGYAFFFFYIYFY